TLQFCKFSGREGMAPKTIAALLLCLLVLAAIPAGAQQVSGSIAGTVIDSSGAAIPNATIIIKNTEQNSVVRTIKSDKNGNYSAPLLPIGKYAVTVEAQGFKKFTRTNITLNEGDKLAISPSLVPGAVET